MPWHTIHRTERDKEFAAEYRKTFDYAQRLETEVVGLRYARAAIAKAKEEE